MVTEGGDNLIPIEHRGHNRAFIFLLVKHQVAKPLREELLRKENPEFPVDEVHYMPMNRPRWNFIIVLHVLSQWQSEDIAEKIRQKYPMDIAVVDVRTVDPQHQR